MSIFIRTFVLRYVTLLLTLGLAAPTVSADSKILATAGGQQIEGQAGGGLVPWALLAGYAEAGEWGGSVAVTGVRVDDFDLRVTGAAVNFGNRFEASIASQQLKVQPLNLSIDQDILAMKWRVGGHVLYGNLPAVTVGAQAKWVRDFAIPELLGAADDHGIDFTASASKLWLNALFGRNVFANVTLRHTEANQTGLLGFGATDGSGPSWVAEGSVALFLNHHWALGAEYRQKPDHLAAVKEDDWRDVFLGWFPNKRFSVIAAYADLGSIAGLTDQSGFYLSLQVTQ